MYEAANTVTQYWDLCLKKKGLKDKNNMYLYSFFMVMYKKKKKNDICFEMKHASIVKLIMLFNFS